MTMRRRVLACPDGVPAGGQIMATYETASGRFHVGVRADEWAEWSRPLAELSVNDDPVVPGARVRGTLGPDPVEVAVVAQALEDGRPFDTDAAFNAAVGAAIAALDRHRMAMASVQPADEGVGAFVRVSPDAETATTD